MIHIHNGGVVAELALRAGLPGVQIAFRETLASGPVPTDVDLEMRAQFLSSEYDLKLLRVRHDLKQLEETLAEAMQEDEVVLWFEHDLFCLINLVSLLVRYAPHRRLTLIWNPQPLSQAELVPLFESRSAVTPSMVKIAAKVWEAYRSNDATGLNRFTKRASPDFPFLREGLRLHASRFPSLRNGLGGIEQRLLEIIAGGPNDFRSIFDRFSVDVPRFGFGDGDVLRTLRRLADGSAPLLSMVEQPASLARAIFTLTPLARKVLAGETDYAELNPPAGWLGGVDLVHENWWRWDERRHEIIPSPSAAS
jgi:Domain of unknown function (DUF1835)